MNPFYFNNFSNGPDLDESKWDAFKDIDMEAFFLSTMPEMYIEHCMFDTLDCRHIWKLRKTKLGNCIQFDLHQEVEAGHRSDIESLDLNSSQVSRNEF